MVLKQQQRRCSGLRTRHLGKGIAAAAIDEARLDAGRAPLRPQRHRHDAGNVLQRHGQVVSRLGQLGEGFAGGLGAGRQLGGQALRRGPLLQRRGEHHLPCAQRRQQARHPHQAVFIHRGQVQHPHRQRGRRARRMALIGVEQPVAQGGGKAEALQRDHAHTQRQKQRGRQQHADGPGPGHEAPLSREKPRDRHPIIVNGTGLADYFAVTRIATWASKILAPFFFRARSVTACRRSAIVPTSGWASVRTTLAVKAIRLRI